MYWNIDWGKAANIASVIEAIVVLVSLYFIWRQLRQQTELTKIANTQNLVELSSPFNLQLIQDRNMAELWVEGAQEFGTYDEIKKYQYNSLLVWWLILHENIFYQKKRGLLDKEIYASWDYDLKVFVKKQQLHERWWMLKDAFQSDFSDYVVKVIEDNEDTPNRSFDPTAR
jgi:hypothetical protein